MPLNLEQMLVSLVQTPSDAVIVVFVMGNFAFNQMLLIFLNRKKIRIEKLMKELLIKSEEIASLKAKLNLHIETSSALKKKVEFLTNYQRTISLELGRLKNLEKIVLNRGLRND